MTDNTTKGRIYTMTSPPPQADAPPEQQGSAPASGKDPLEQAQNEATGVLQKKWDDLKAGLGTLKDATGLGVNPEMATAARQRMMQGAKDMAKGLVSLVGAPPELVQAAYMSGNPELIAMVQKMQAQQTATVQAIADNVKDSVSQAYQRNGVAGAGAMVLTALGTEVVGGKGGGMLMNAAGKAADIVRLAKTPAEAASLLRKEAEAAKAAGKLEEAKLFEKQAVEREAQAAREAPKDGVAVKAPLRAEYEAKVRDLQKKEKQMRESGKSDEEIARELHKDRRALGVEYKDLTPPEMLEKIYTRNLEKYGDKLGPTIEWLQSKGKSWAQIIESATRTGGKDLGL